MKLRAEGDNCEFKWRTLRDEFLDEDPNEVKNTVLTSNAACHRINRTDYLLVGGQCGGKRSNQMHFLNLEMRLSINVEDTLSSPMFPCIMLRELNTHVYIVGGVDTEKYEDMFLEVTVEK